MAQHDYNIANQSGADFRSDLNNALSAIASTNSGDTSPTTTFANQLWIDTANNVLKIRNEGNSAWITTGISITADNTFNIDGGTVNGITALSFSSGSSVTTILDEDNLGSNSATALATQQSIKAYVDSQVGSVDTLAEILTNGNTTGGTDISLSSSDITGTGNINITGTIQSSGAITGNLTGNVTGNASTATALQTARTINGASFDGTANISFNTDSVNEGSSNLYFTNARVESYLDAGSATPTFASAVINSSLTGSAILDDDTFGTASATTVATSESIKAYVDSQVATADSLAEVLANGNTTGGSNILFGDNDKAIFGAGSDLSIYHDVSNSYIKDNGTGNLNIQSNGVGVVIAHTDGTDLAVFNSGNGTANLYHSGSLKIATTSTGIDVTGVITTDGLTTSADINFGDNDKAIFGAGSDLQIYHDGNNSRVEDAGTGGLRLIGSNFVSLQSSSGENKVVANSNGAVTLYYDNSPKLATTSSGIDVTGTVTSDGLTVSGAGTIINSGFNSGTALTVKGDSGNGLKTQYIFESGTNQYNWQLGFSTHASQTFSITPSTAANGTTFSNPVVNINQNGNFDIKGGDISFYDDTGSSAAFFWDASAESLGIGTSSPDEKLHIHASSGDGIIKITGDGSETNGGRIKGFNGGLGIETTDGAGNYPERIRIDSSGKVGIGTASPDTLLHLSGADTAIIRLENSDSSLTTNQIIGGLEFEKTDGSGAGAGVVGGLRMYSEGGVGESTYLTLSTSSSSANNVEAMRIDSSGNLLVGRSSSLTDSKIQSDQGVTIFYPSTNNYWQMYRSSDNTFRFSNGTVAPYISDAGAFTNASDERLKENIVDSTHGLSSVLASNPRSFKFKHSDGKQVGFIAQELKGIIPEVVDGSEDDDDMMGVNYGALVAIAFKAIQEQQTQIEALQSEINNLKGE